MKNISKFMVLPAILGTAVLIDGCGGSSSSKHKSSTVEISGRAMKGVLANADCIVSNTGGITLYSSVGEDNACTGSNGRYSITLSSTTESDLDLPVSVEIRARSTETTYKCDLPAGCEGQSFGAAVPITDATFSLKAFVPSLNRGTSSAVETVSVTPWTNIAARRVETVAGTGTITADQIEKAYGEVAGVLNNVLGLDGTSSSFNTNFFELDVADVTNPITDDVNESDKQLGTLLSFASASVIGLVNESTANTSITAVIDNMANAFKNDGLFDVNPTAANIDDTALNIDLTSIVTNISNVVQNISINLDAANQILLNQNLGGSDTNDALGALETTTQAIVTQKESVTDANNDPTAPVAVPGSGGTPTGGTGTGN